MVDHADVRLDAGDHDGGLDELVEGDVVAQPATLGADLEEPADLAADAGDELVEVAVELGIVGGSAVQRPGRLRRALVDAVCSVTMRSTASSRSVMATKRWPRSRSSTLWSPVTPNAANSTAAIISAALEPWACTVSTETPAAAAILDNVVRA